MNLLWIPIGILLFLIYICAYQVWKIYKLYQNIQKEIKSTTPTPTQIVDLQPLYKQLDALPNKVLTSITNSTNTYKGALGELIGYINLRASYDRIIPLGSIVDFVCIRFPSNEDPGCVDFVDIKTGNNARLSKDQRSLQKLIKDKKINFCQIKIESSNADHSQGN